MYVEYYCGSKDALHYKSSFIIVTGGIAMAYR